MDPWNKKVWDQAAEMQESMCSKEAPTKPCLGIQPEKILVIMSVAVKFSSSTRSICVTEKSILEHCSKLVKSLYWLKSSGVKGIHLEKVHLQHD